MNLNNLDINLKQMFYEESEMREGLACPICQDLYSDPRLLPCGDAVCNICILSSRWSGFSAVCDSFDDPIPMIRRSIPVSNACCMASICPWCSGCIRAIRNHVWGGWDIWSIQVKLFREYLFLALYPYFYAQQWAVFWYQNCVFWEIRDAQMLYLVR